MSAVKKIVIIYFIIEACTVAWLAADPCPYASYTACGDRAAAWASGLMAGNVWPVYWTYKIFMEVRKP